VQLRIDGAGDERLFTLSSNGTFTTPAEDFGTLAGGLAVNYYEPEMEEPI
jgi:hypothetical protein